MQLFKLNLVRNQLAVDNLLTIRIFQGLAWDDKAALSQNTQPPRDGDGILQQQARCGNAGSTVDGIVITYMFKLNAPSWAAFLVRDWSTTYGSPMHSLAVVLDGPCHDATSSRSRWQVQENAKNVQNGCQMVLVRTRYKTSERYAPEGRN